MDAKKVPLLSEIIPQYEGKIDPETIEVAYRYLRERIDSLGPVVKENGSKPLVGESDQEWDKDSQKITEIEKRQALDRSVKQAFDDCQKAWDKMVAGTYGLCDVCGNFIHKDRLKVLPMASNCSVCQKKKKQTIY